MKKFCFTVDDNIRFLRMLTAENADSLFSNPYLVMYKRLHEKYRLKVQLNLFYEMPGFDLSQMTDRFKAEWAENAHWLKLSFHSRLENVDPYLSSGYQEVYRDCEAVHKEILRFAGEQSLGKTTTIHYCRTTEEGLRALRDHGIRGLLGLFGTDKAPRNSYSLPESDTSLLRKGEILHRHELDFYSIDLVMNLYDREELLRRLHALLNRDALRVMIHEQYFYSDYHAYQPDFEEKLDHAFGLLCKNGYESCFAEEF
ncbi:MAG: hypothetical protein E7335_03035 [Clostridiales bacterium]|nr:hypothetical protein [Clostridiales bacterium]